MTTGCMIPVMMKSDIGEICYKDSHLDEGDIFAILRNQTYIVHRFRGRLADGRLLHQGDLTIIPAESLPDDVVLGRVNYICRGQRFLFLDQPSIKTISRYFVRLTRLEFRVLEVLTVLHPICEELLLYVHRILNILLWSLCWKFLSCVKR